MVLGIVIFLVAYALIVSEKMDKTIPSMLGAAAMVIFGVAGFPELLLVLLSGNSPRSPLS